MERLKNPKTIAALVMAALAALVFFQNRDEVVLQVLFLYEVRTTEASALATAFVAGLATGALAFSRWQSQRNRSKEPTSS